MKHFNLNIILETAREQVDEPDLFIREIKRRVCVHGHDGGKLYILLE